MPACYGLVIATRAYVNSCASAVTNSYKQLQTVTKIIAKTLYRRKGRCIIQIMGSANG